MEGSRRLRRPASLWCGSAQGVGLAVVAAALAFAYQALVLGPLDERQTLRAFGGWERDPYESWILGEGSAMLDVQCDLKRLPASALPSPEAFERLYRGKRPVVLMGRGPGQGWTPAARRRGPWFLGDDDGGSDDIWTLEGLRAALDGESEEEGAEETLLRVVEDGRDLLRAEWWGRQHEVGDGSCVSDVDGVGGWTRMMTLDAFLAMGMEQSSDDEAEGEEEAEEAYLCDSAILSSHPTLRSSSLGRAMPAPLATAFANASTFLAVGRSRGGLPWHVVQGETWAGSVAGGFTQWLLYPPGRGLRNVTMGGLGAGQTHPLLSPWEFVMHALPFIEHVGPDGGGVPLAAAASSSPDMEAPKPPTAGDVPPLSCLLRPGDMLYIPAGGWKAMRLHVGDVLLVGGTVAADEARVAEESRAIFEQQNPLDVEALLHAGLGLAHRALKEAPPPTAASIDDALVFLRRAAALRPCDDGPHAALAHTLWRAGAALDNPNYQQEAVDVLRAAERLFVLGGDACPLPAWMSEQRRRRLLAGARMRLARVWLRMGNDKEARRALEEITQLDGDFAPSRKVLEALN